MSDVRVPYISFFVPPEGILPYFFILSSLSLLKLLTKKMSLLYLRSKPEAVDIVSRE